MLEYHYFFRRLFREKENLWIVGKTGKIFEYHHQFDRFIPTYKPANLSLSISYSYLDNRGNIWLCDKDSIILYNTQSDQISRIYNPLSSNITSMVQSDNSHFFIATEKGIRYCCINDNELQPIPIPPLDEIKGQISELYYHRVLKRLFIGTLDKENHKFQYKEVEHGGRAQKYFSSIEWLLRADMVHLCKLVTDVRFDLDDYARDDFFRAYTTDLSLLMAMKDFSLKQHIVENTLFGNSKGGIYECAIADALYKKGYPLYFYKNETTKRKIDVMIQKDDVVVPIEVKSGNTRANSLKSILKMNADIPYGYKFVDGNIGVSDDGIITLPLYMIAFI